MEGIGWAHVRESEEEGFEGGVGNSVRVLVNEVSSLVFGNFEGEGVERPKWGRAWWTC